MRAMRCPNCDQPVEVPPADDVRFVVRQDTSTYLVLAEHCLGTRLVHECALRGVEVTAR
jgi:NAD-dependent dihydropyrimidine dehydrogenase PreA subunit